MDFRDFKPCLLIAMPELKDPNFERTVVLLSDLTADGAVGFIINRPSSLTLGDSVVLSEGELNPGYQNHPLWNGGPVDPNKIWILYDQSAYESLKGVDLGSGLGLAHDVDVLLDREKTLSPSQIRLLHGYAGWGGKQLEAEIAASFWLTAPLYSDLILKTEPEKIWESALKQLGIEAHRLMAPPSHFLQ